MQLDTMGVKRKFDDLEASVDLQCYGKQRQSILNITMQKLCTIPERRVEPPLYRNVLIRNTLKHIEQELHDEGITLPMMPSMDSNFSYTNMDSSDCFLDHLPTDSSDSQDKGNHDIVNSITGLRPLDYTTSEHMDMTETGETNIAVSPTVRSVNGDSSSSSVVPLMTSLDRLSTFEGSVSIAQIPSPTSPLQKADDIFGDIDLSPFDVDFVALANSSSKLTPLSAEEVLHTFPGVTTTNLSSPTSPSSATAETPTYTSLINTQCSSYCRTDVLEDLDNIMQILIEI
ncbi:Hypothetical predicted protein [Octopus vulgaris]|uniref:Uncharacterized protein n=2 Tax=Octopus TaxID=6643 RepID=A0AA36F4S7_OCTVU|nr:uncharacterized protein LOC115212765 [Octopus sinensis]XP_029637299.1 uncharacterized protein LOC115212765 [Octopus sinensis]CAI9724492.1 Hypothetical predicted protein [Octopus vulgaris]